MKTETKMLGIGMTQPNVVKVMSGAKTQTRRIEACLRGLPPVESVKAKVGQGYEIGLHHGKFQLFGAVGVVRDMMGGEMRYEFSPRHQVGDRLYVKEALEREAIIRRRHLPESHPKYESAIAVYRSDRVAVESLKETKLCRPWESDDGTPWKNKVIPARYMPRSAARTFIEITDVRCERIQDISLCDIRAEGMRFSMFPPDAEIVKLGERQLFRSLWDDTNGKGAWERNDWTFAYTFKLIN